MKKLLIILVLSILSSNLIYSQWSGSGTEEDPYLIKTLADLQALNGFPLDENNHFLQVYDILDGLTQPINFFCGSYDGNGKIIELAMEDTLNYTEFALFRRVVGNSIIKNLTVSGYIRASIKKNEKFTTLSAGFIHKIEPYYNTKEFKHIQIINCTNKVNVQAIFAAGFVNRNEPDTTMKLSIIDSKNLGNILGWAVSAGFIVQHFHNVNYNGKDANIVQLVLSNCTNYGKIMIIDTSSFAFSACAVLVAQLRDHKFSDSLSLIIENCVNAGVVGFRTNETNPLRFWPPFVAWFWTAEDIIF